MIKLTSWIGLGVLGVAAAGGACTVNSTNITNGDDGGTGTDATTDDGGSASETSVGAETGAETSTDAGTDGAVEAEAAAPPMTNIRVANWSPDAPAAGFDFCIAPHSTTTWTGPILAGELAAVDGGAPDGGDGGTVAIAFPQVTAYHQLTPGQYDLQIVAAGATSCTTGVTSTTTTIPSLAANAYSTFAIVGDTTMSGSDSPLKVVWFTDDSTAPTGALLRFINAAPDLAAVDFGQGSLGMTNFQPLFTNVQYYTAGATGGDAGTVDTNDYVAQSALSAAKFSAHTSTGGTSDSATASSVTVAAGSIATMVLVYGKNGVVSPPPQFLLCLDNTATAGLFASCSLQTP
jgi:hypothetical protein